MSKANTTHNFQFSIFNFQFSTPRSGNNFQLSIFNFQLLLFLPFLVKRAGSITKLSTTNGKIIQVVTDRIVTIKKGFTVSDNIGNNFVLLNDFTSSGYGIHDLLFQSQIIGNVTVELNTVTNIVTPTLGVAIIGNTSAPVNIGVDEESDLDLRTRFNKSVAIDGNSHLDNLYSRILNLAGVVGCYIDNNRTNETNEYGTPAHSIWAIVKGGDDDEIAQTIYSTISDGCGMRGNTTIEIIDSQGNNEQISFDRITPELLYIYIVES